MTPAQEQAIRQAIAYKRAYGETALVVLAPFADEDAELDGVPVYGSSIMAIRKQDGSLLDADTAFLVLARDEWDRASGVFAEEHAPALMAEISEALR